MIEQHTCGIHILYYRTTAQDEKRMPLTSKRVVKIKKIKYTRVLHTIELSIMNNDKYVE